MKPEQEYCQDSTRPQTLAELAAEGSSCCEYKGDDEADVMKRVDDSEDEEFAVNALEADLGEESQEEYQDIEVQGASDDEDGFQVGVAALSKITRSIYHRNLVVSGTLSSQGLAAGLSWSQKEPGLKYFERLRKWAMDEASYANRANQKGKHATDGEHLYAKAKVHLANRDKWNREASQGLYTYYNWGLPSYRIDLHGQFVREAIAFVKKAVERKESYLELIVGQGLHTPKGQAPALKLGVTAYLQQFGHYVREHPDNAGVLLVSLSQETNELPVLETGNGNPPSA